MFDVLALQELTADQTDSAPAAVDHSTYSIICSVLTF